MTTLKSNQHMFAMAGGKTPAERYRAMMQPSNRTPAFFAQASQDGKNAEMHLYDIIGDECYGFISAKTVARFLNEHQDIEELTLRINSPGGDCFEGIAIYNLLKDCKALVNVYIDGIAASISSVIPMSGDEIHIAANGSIFIHNPWGCVCGEAGDMEKSASMLNTIKQQLVNTYAARTSAKEEDIAAMMDAGTYMTGDEAKEKGFVDSVEPLKLRAAAFGDSPMFKAMIEDAPEDRRAALEALAKGEEEAEEGAGSGEQEAGEVGGEETPAEEVAGKETTAGEEAAENNEPEAVEETPSEDEPTDPKAELRTYMDAFGAENGANWYAEGKSFVDAMAQHNRDLMAENAKLAEQLRQAGSIDDEQPPVSHNATHTDEVAARTAEKKNMQDRGISGGVASLAASLKTRSLKK